MHRARGYFARREHSSLRGTSQHQHRLDRRPAAPDARDAGSTPSAELLRLRPEHASIYMLEIDEGSRLGKESLAGGSRYSAAPFPPTMPWPISTHPRCARLAAAGYEHYEISNWALPGRRSLHNLKYWRREPYLGFGAGAHSFAYSEAGPTRWANVHDSARYVAMIEQGLSPREQIEAVSAEQAFDEELFLGLRQLEGIDVAGHRAEVRTTAMAGALRGLPAPHLRFAGAMAWSNSTARGCASRPIASPFPMKSSSNCSAR